VSELPDQTLEWLMEEEVGILDAKIKKAAKRVSDARRILGKLSRPLASLAGVGGDVARLERDFLSQPSKLRPAEDEYREADDALAYLTSKRRYVRIVRAGLPIEVVEVVDFLNKTPLVTDQSTSCARECVLSCIKELIEFGAKLKEIARANPGGRAPTFDALSRQPAVREELHRMLTGSAFQTAGEIARRCQVGHDDSLFLPLAFYGQMVRHPVLSGDHGAQAVWHFLDVVCRTDPRLWRICANCGDVFLQVRRRGDTEFCADPCRMERHNRSKERMIIRLYAENGGFREDEELETSIKTALVSRFRTASRIQEKEIRGIGEEAYLKMCSRIIEISRGSRTRRVPLSGERVRAILLKENHRLAYSLNAAGIARILKRR
jgi:hypothetical protein